MYTATITRNFRDIHTMTPKVLLLNITTAEGIFRDHCWVPITNNIQKFIPRKNTQKLLISFIAKIRTYQTYGPAKQTLQAIKDIQIIKRIK